MPRGGGVVARVGEELELLDVCLQRCGAGVAEALIGFIVCLERILAQDAVGGFQTGNKGSLAERMFVAVLVKGGLELQVRIGEHRENIARGVRHLACAREELFLLEAQNVVALAENAVEVAAVKRKLRLLTVEFRHFSSGIERSSGVSKLVFSSAST